MKSNILKLLFILATAIFSFLGCQNEEVIDSSISNVTTFKAPSIANAQSYFNANAKLSNLKINILNRTDEDEFSIDWENSTTKKYKEPTVDIPQEVEILYTPIPINTNGNAKIFVASTEQDNVVDSKFFCIIYTNTNNLSLFSGYILIYSLDGYLENIHKYEEGNKVTIPSNDRMVERGGDDNNPFDTLGDLLDWLGGDWFGVAGFLTNDEVIVNANNPEFTNVEGGGAVDWYSPSIYIPVIDFSGSGGGSGNTYTNTWWTPASVIANGLAISYILNLPTNSIQSEWLINTATQAQLNSIADYLNESNNNFINNIFLIDVIINLINIPSYFDVNTYPGIDEGLPFEWWLDNQFIESNFSFNTNVEGLGDLTDAEKLLVNLFPLQALIIRENKLPAESETQARFGTNGINDKSDAFRHAYFNAMNSNDAGDTIARLFSNAHESEVSLNLILEKQMDLFNNNVGHIIGDNASFFISDGELSNLVYQKILNGSLNYLFPINYNDPNFWDKPQTTTPNDGDHGITNLTQLIPTNQ